MKAGPTIKKILFISIWILIGGGMLSLLLAAIGNKNKGIVKDYVISFRGEEKNIFISPKDVETLLVNAVHGNIKGHPVAGLNLHEIEQSLEHNSWIDEAQIYFDNANVMHVTVSEKKPVARVFTLTNQSFFIDSMGRIIPVSSQATAKLPVFTGFPGKKELTVQDSSLLNEVKIVANFISRDPFWTAQVAQVDITPSKTFEMIPEVGNHLVRLGNSDHIDRKFNRLLIFYKQVLSRTSFDRYKTIDVQYKGQVVVSRSEGNPKIDSIQLRRNVEKLMKLSQDAERDTVIKALPMIKLEADSANDDDPTLIDKPMPVPGNDANRVVPARKEIKPTVNKSANKPASKEPAKPLKEAEPQAEKVEQKREPKAVMPKKN